MQTIWVLQAFGFTDLLFHICMIVYLWCWSCCCRPSTSTVCKLWWKATFGSRYEDTIIIRWIRISLASFFVRDTIVCWKIEQVICAHWVGLTSCFTSWEVTSVILSYFKMIFYLASTCLESKLGWVRYMSSENLVTKKASWHAVRTLVIIEFASAILFD